MAESVEQVIDTALNELEKKWEDWQPMPCPENCRKIDGPKKAGIYQIRNKITKELVLFGTGKERQKRMRSLFPEPDGVHGVQGRNNIDKREYVLNNWENLQYRTMKTNCKEQAEAVESLLKAKINYRFNT